MGVITKLIPGGDFMQAEGDPIVTRESRTMANGTGADWALDAGYPMDDGVPIVAGDIGNLDGLLLQPARVADEDGLQVGVLARGPAAVNIDALPTVDYLDAAFNMVAFRAAIVALGIVVRTEPENQEIQTT